MPKGDPAGYLPDVVQQRKQAGKKPHGKGKKNPKKARLKKLAAKAFGG